LIVLLCFSGLEMIGNIVDDLTYLYFAKMTLQTVPLKLDVKLRKGGPRRWAALEKPNAHLSKQS
jgi:hypothetical protein